MTNDEDPFGTLELLVLVWLATVSIWLVTGYARMVQGVLHPPPPLTWWEICSLVSLCS